MTEKMCEKCGKTVDIRGFYQHHKNCKGTLQGAGTETEAPTKNNIQTVPPPVQPSAPIQQTAPPATTIPSNTVPANKAWNGYIYQGD